MSESVTNGNSQYDNIVDWLKKYPICSIDETIDNDNTVSVIKTSYFEDFKIGIYVYKNDVGRVEII